MRTKLRKGKVFTCVCLFGEGGIGTSHLSWDRSHGRVPNFSFRFPSPPFPWTSNQGPILSPFYTIIIGELFKLVHARTYSTLVLTSSDGHQKHVGNTVGKRVVSILMECCLVDRINLEDMFLSEGYLFVFYLYELFQLSNLNLSFTQSG